MLQQLVGKSIWVQYWFVSLKIYWLFFSSRVFSLNTFASNFQSQDGIMGIFFFIFLLQNNLLFDEVIDILFLLNYQYLMELLVPLVSSAAVNSQTNEEVAIKKIGNAFDNRIDAKRTLREIKLLRHMGHENVSLVQIWHDFFTF